MEKYIEKQYEYTKVKYEKFSERLLRIQANGEFNRLTEHKQFSLVNRVRKLWKKLRLLEVQMKPTIAMASLALLLLSTNVKAQSQFVEAPDKNPLPPPTINGSEPIIIDLDMDGDLDILTSIDYNTIAWYQNVGTASDPKYVKASEENNPFAQLDDELEMGTWDFEAFGDIDNDGDMDILTDEDIILINTGSNNSIIYTEESTNLPYSFKVGDLDGDGDLDLLSIDKGYSDLDTIPLSVSIYNNTGDANNFEIDYDDRDTIALGEIPDEYYLNDFHFIDLDFDGDLDILVNTENWDNNTNQRSCFYFENIGTPTQAEFSQKDENPFSALEDVITQLGDFDNDGDYDVLSGGYYTQMAFYENTGEELIPNETIIEELYNGIQLPISYYFTPQFIDYDGDGDLDVTTMSYYNNWESEYFECIESDNQLKYRKVETEIYPFLNDDPTTIKIPFFVDLDQDGDIDALVMNLDYEYYGFKYYYYENTGSKQVMDFSKEPVLDLFDYSEEYFIMPSFSDIDGDGDLDIIYSSYEGENGILFYENTGSNTNLIYTLKPTETNPFSSISEDLFLAFSKLFFSDIDADGDYDLISGGGYSYSESSILYIENTGSATNPVFNATSETNPFEGLAGIYSQINLVDYDKDGDDDLFIHDNYGSITRYFENTIEPNGIPRITEKLPISIFPNPVEKYLNLKINAQFEGELSLTLINVEGKTSFLGKYNCNAEKNTLSIPVKNYPKGSYMLHVTSEKATYNQKLIIK
ncbi:MAG: T9SS type A sorting domain-containing protein [Prolixibacteraceae bacterium]|jgi:hypothetical protein|nr:T9SS type A sorting domain-containing protein [Prolixibacteraceae bacterium]